MNNLTFVAIAIGVEFAIATMTRCPSDIMDQDLTKKLMPSPNATLCAERGFPIECSRATLVVDRCPGDDLRITP